MYPQSSSVPTNASLVSEIAHHHQQLTTQIRLDRELMDEMKSVMPQYSNPVAIQGCSEYQSLLETYVDKGEELLDKWRSLTTAIQTGTEIPTASESGGRHSMQPSLGPTPHTQSGGADAATWMKEAVEYLPPPFSSSPSEPSQSEAPRTARCRVQFDASKDTKDTKQRFGEWDYTAASDIREIPSATKEHLAKDGELLASVI